jgi:ferredoxin
MGRLRVVVDRDLCQGHAMCVLEDPDVFAVESGADQVTLLDESPDDSHRESVGNAVRYCPATALSLEEDR